jgi:hypothetical protein
LTSGDIKNYFGEVYGVIFDSKNKRETKLYNINGAKD